jgi:hypothetical protein
VKPDLENPQVLAAVCILGGLVLVVLLVVVQLLVAQ